QVEQLTPLWGLRFAAGYGNGEDWPIYDAKNITGVYGQWFASAVLPLWRDRSIDEFRLRRRLAEIELHVSQAAAVRQQVSTLTGAGAAFWEWVAAGQQLRLATERRVLAASRQAGSERQVRSGDAPAIVAVGN